MDIFNTLKDDSIIVCELNYKRQLLKKISEMKLLINIKFLTLDELYKNYFFSYNEETIYYIMKKYNYNYEFSLEVLDNLKYIEEKKYKNTNLLLLKNIKQDLINKDKLIFNKYFKNYIKDKNIIFYGYNYIDSFNKKMIDEIGKNSRITLFDKKYTQYIHKVCEFENIIEEIEFVASNICELINSGIDINKIKIIKLPSIYNNDIKRIFSLYNIPLKLNEKNPLLSTIIGKDFVNHLDNGIDFSISYIKEKYINKKNNILNQIIDIVNKYYYLGNDDVVKELIIYDLKNTNIIEEELENKVEVITNFEQIESNYYYVLGFNSDNYPDIIKSNGLILEKEREILELESLLTLNKQNKESIIKNIENAKNLCISYCMFNNKSICYPSNLITEMNLEVITPKNNYIYSNMYNKLKLAMLLDDYYIYNITNINLSLLYKNYSIPYLKYDNKYKTLNLEYYKKYLSTRNISLSYSNIDTYNKCSFSYYLKNILKLDGFETNITSIIGTVFHNILDDYYKTKKLNYKLNDNILNYNLTNEEKYYINKSIDIFKNIVPNIINQASNMKFNEHKTEDKIEIKLDENIYLIGFVDKIFIFNNDICKYAIVIDYKSYEKDFDKSLIKYGINIQLPIYYYLVKNKYKDLNIIGLYYQNIFPYDMKYDLSIKYKNRIKDNIKLCGITLDDPLLIELIDKDYYNSSIIKGMKVKKDGSFYASAKVLSNKEFDNLFKEVGKIINNNLNDILKARFDINPKIYKNTNISCEYCKYKDICFKTYKDNIILEEGDISDIVD